MPRRIKSAKIGSRAARATLKAAEKPVYADLGARLHLGYRRNKSGGKWVARHYLGGEDYTTKTLAEADDLADANGVTVLNFDQAVIAARQWGSEREAEERIAAFGPVITVKIAIREYMEKREKRSTEIDARGKLRHVLTDAKLAETPVAALTVADLKKWRAGLLASMTEASARRVCNDFRAALNFAVKIHELPATISATISNAFAVEGAVDNDREKQLLEEDELDRVIAAAAKVDKEGGWEGGLLAIVLVLSETGARFSQVQRLRVADLQVAQSRLMMPTSRKGKGSKASHVPVPVGPYVLDVLKRATDGRAGSDFLLQRPYWRPAPGPGVGTMQVYDRGPWRAASSLTRPWKAIVEKARLRDDLVPYCLRHSSIVRGLSAGLPTQLVAQLHDTSVTMIERYYGRYVADALHKLARAALKPITPPFPRVAEV
jgi:integrase